MKKKTLQTRKLKNTEK